MQLLFCSTEQFVMDKLPVAQYFSVSKNSKWQRYNEELTHSSTSLKSGHA
jgi:hypothetical protein